MAFKYRRTALLGKIETVYATDPTPTGAANAILATDITIDPLVATEVKRDLQLHVAGQDLAILAGLHVMMTFKVELQASGTLGVAPAWGPLIRATGFAETITADTKVEYTLISDAEESATLYFYADKGLHKLTGARGKVSIGFGKLGIPYLTFEMTGIYNPVAAAAFPGTITLTGFKKPKTFGKVNTPTCTLDAYAAKTSQLQLDVGQQVEYRDYANQQEVVITDRTPGGSITIETPDPAAKNYFAIVEAESAVALQVVHGTVEGYVVTLDAPYLQLMQPKRQNDNGVAMTQFNINPTRSAGNDEVKLTLT